MLFENVYNEWMVSDKECRNTQTVIRGIKSIFTKLILPYLGNKEIKEVKTFHLQMVLNNIRSKTDSKTYIYKVDLYLRQLFHFASAKNYILINQMDFMARPKKYQNPQKTGLSKAKIKKLLKMAEGTEIYNLIILLLTTGITASEACALRWNDFEEENNILHIRNMLQSHLKNERIKGSKSPRKLIISRISLKALLNEKEKQISNNIFDENGFVFKNDANKGIHLDYIKNRLKPMLNQLGVEKYNSNIFRFTLVKLFKNHRKNLTFVQYYLGMKSNVQYGITYLQDNLESFNE